MFKKELAEKAAIHTKKMNDFYLDKINESVRTTKMYSNRVMLDNKIKLKENKCECIVTNLDTVGAIMSIRKKNPNAKIAALNFASYKNPGGKFLEGSTAQEEALCHDSYLYNVLSQFDTSFYAYNRQNVNLGMYFNRGLYTPNILFTPEDGGDGYMADIITVAAPNKGTAQRYYDVTDLENHNALVSRIRFIFEIAINNDVDFLILGAFGCGVFKQNPYEVAGVFKQWQEYYEPYLKGICYAVPNGRGIPAVALNNYTAFNAIIMNKE